MALMPRFFSNGPATPRAEDVPEGVRAIIRGTLLQNPSSLNTDWFGTTLLQGLLEWHSRGVTDTRQFAAGWLEHHIHSGKLSSYSGAKSREVVAGGIHVTTYAGHFGLAFPCYEMAVQFGSAEARQACIELSRIILHRTARNRIGMVEHDDSGEFAIPDTCYFVVGALMRAYALAPEMGQAFLDQAVYQLRVYVDTFLSADNGLARTVLFKQGMGQTCWTRASGWLLWAIISVLRLLPRGHPASAFCLENLRSLVNGMERVQQGSGGFRVLLNDPGTPVETTGTAMFASGVHEAVRKKWLPRSHLDAASHAWSFVKDNIDDDGGIRAAFTGWALPAEQRRMSMDEHKMGWIPGFILIVANEMTQLIQP
jgi:hypothetical protein